MPDFEMAMKRVYAWYEKEIIDRAPVRFVAHNAFVEQANQAYPSANIKEKTYFCGSPPKVKQKSWP